MNTGASTRHSFERTFKHKFISRKQIRENLRDIDILRSIRKREGLVVNEPTIISYGSPIGTYITSIFSDDDCLTEEQAVKTLKEHKSKNKVKLPEYQNLDVFRKKKK